MVWRVMNVEAAFCKTAKFIKHLPLTTSLFCQVFIPTTLYLSLDTPLPLLQHYCLGLPSRSHYLGLMHGRFILSFLLSLEFSAQF